MPRPPFTLTTTGYTPHTLLIGGRPVAIQLPVVILVPANQRRAA